jgi:hypothetical protein
MTQVIGPEFKPQFFKKRKKTKTKKQRSRQKHFILEEVRCEAGAKRGVKQECVCHQAS